jgi:spore coat polysaccharide biosynthesis protein SpsF
VNVVTVIQARMGSTRLPGKVLFPVGGKTVLAWVVHRARLARLAGEITVATSEHARDDAVADACVDIGISCFRGSEIDVLDRYRRAARAYAADAIVRITADCPLLDPELLDKIIEAYLSGGVDYVSAEGVPRGLAQEIISTTTLEWAWRHAKSAEDREHVTIYVVDRPAEFRVVMLPPPSGLDLPDWRLTLDTPEDLELLEGLFDTTKRALFDLSATEIVGAVARDPHLLALATRE